MNESQTAAVSRRPVKTDGDLFAIVGIALLLAGGIIALSYPALTLAVLAGAAAPGLVRRARRLADLRVGRVGRSTPGARP